MGADDDGRHRLALGREAQVDADLVVIDSGDAYLVAVEGDDEDWLVRFEQTEDFDAHGWAANMANVYNRRRRGSAGNARFEARRPE